MSHFFNHIIIREEHNIPNWIQDEFGRFTLKSARTFYWNQEFPMVGVNSFGLHTLEKFSWTASYKSSYSK